MKPLYISDKDYILYTDGASKGNPGPSAWAWFDPQVPDQWMGYTPKATNSEMELKAIYHAIKYFISERLSVVSRMFDRLTIITDSKYCHDIYTKWVDKWIAQGILSEKKHSSLIMDTQLAIQEIRSNGLRVRIAHVRGHSGEQGNEFADKLCNRAISMKFTETRIY
ncbi:MAG: hypothetical protein MJZ15_00655 [Bacteroidales bacterium]|nr:hypothetical protein [Bacteroidales bacterium]